MNPALSLLVRAALTAAGLAVTLLPRRLEVALGPWLGRLYLLVDPKRRRIARENIARCLPELGPAGQKRLLMKNFEHYGALGLELMHLCSPVPGHYAAYADRISTLEGLEHWKRANAKGKGVIFFSAHLANWELCAKVALAGVPLTIVTRTLKPQWLNDKVVAERATVGIESIITSRTIPVIMKTLRRGGSVVFVMDQYAAPPAGLPVRFFGATVDTLAAIGTIASRTGAAILPGTQERDARGVIRVVLYPELDLGEDLHDPVKSTQLLAAKVEGWIRKNPAQWLWAHRRFKNAVWPGPVEAPR